MAHTNINFHHAVFADGRFTIFVQPDAFSSQSVSDVYSGVVLDVGTDMAAIVRLAGPVEYVFATNKDIRHAITAGIPIWIAHLHPDLGYVADQAKLALTMNLNEGAVYAEIETLDEDVAA